MTTNAQPPPWLAAGLLPLPVSAGLPIRLSWAGASAGDPSVPTPTVGDGLDDGLGLDDAVTTADGAAVVGGGATGAALVGAGAGTGTDETCEA